MSVGSNYRLSLFKIKSQAVSHMALTLKLLALQHIHLWRRLTKGCSIKKTILFYPRRHKRFQIFSWPITFPQGREKGRRKFPCRKSLSLFFHKFHSWIKFGLSCNVYQTGLLYIALPSVKLRGAVIKTVSFWSEMEVKLRSDRLFNLSL